MNNPLGVSPSKGKQGTTRGKEKIFWPRWESNPRPPDYIYRHSADWATRSHRESVRSDLAQKQLGLVRTYTPGLRSVQITRYCGNHTYQRVTIKPIKRQFNRRLPFSRFGEYAKFKANWVIIYSHVLYISRALRSEYLPAEARASNIRVKHLFEREEFSQREWI